MNKKGADWLSPGILVMIILGVILGTWLIYYIWTLKTRLAV